MFFSFKGFLFALFFAPSLFAATKCERISKAIRFYSKFETEARVFEAIRSNRTLAKNTLMLLGFSDVVAEKLSQSDEPALPAVLTTRFRIVSPNYFILDSLRAQNPSQSGHSEAKAAVKMYRGLNIPDLRDYEPLFFPRELVQTKPYAEIDGSVGIAWLAPDIEDAVSYASGDRTPHNDVSHDSGYVLEFDLPEFIVHRNWRYPVEEGYILDLHIKNPFNYVARIYYSRSADTKPLAWKNIPTALLKRWLNSDRKPVRLSKKVWPESWNRE